MAYSDIMKNLPKQSSKLERFDEAPKLKICLYKATWCSFCTKYTQSNIFNNTYSSIKDDDMHKGVVFVTYDFDENKALAEKYNINSFPSIIAVDAQGNLIDTFEGDRMKKDELIKFVDQNLQKVS